jgi:hypothetical protein
MWKIDFCSTWESRQTLFLRSFHQQTSQKREQEWRSLWRLPCRLRPRLTASDIIQCAELEYRDNLVCRTREDSSPADITHLGEDQNEEGREMTKKTRNGINSIYWKFKKKKT